VRQWDEVQALLREPASVGRRDARDGERGRLEEVQGQAPASRVTAVTGPMLAAGAEHLPPAGFSVGPDNTAGTLRLAVEAAGEPRDSDGADGANGR